jgi:hypothetical protein
VRSPFQILLKLFRDRFFENDSVSPGGGFQTNVNQMLGVLITVGLLAGYIVLVTSADISHGARSIPAEWLIRSLRLFLPSFSFGMAGFTALFYWDALFPDRRDFLILAPFPIPLRQLVAAKFSALLLFILLLVSAVNVTPDSMVLLSLFGSNSLGAWLRLATAQIAATFGASAFAFLAVAAGQGILISLTSASVFRRISPWIQMLGMSAMVMTVLGFPFFAGVLRPAVEQKQWWLYLFPPVWFSGLYEMLLAAGNQFPNQFLVSLGMLAIKMTALALFVMLVTWGIGFRRHFRRTLEAEDAPHSPRTWFLPHWSVPRWLAASPQERALFGFAGKTLARSQKHQFFLATYLSAGLSISLFFGVAIGNGRIVLSPGGVRSVAFVLGFFLVSGFRGVFQFPAELAANWLFRITESRWTEVSRNATRKLVLAIGLVPLLMLALPWEMMALKIAAWNWPIVLEHLAVQLMAAALLVELLFWNFDKVPFTCSYFPGSTSLAVLVVLYIYGITGYSFNMADLERAMERHGTVAVLFFAVTAVALILAWRRHPAADGVRFDGSEPVIRTLELS